MQIKLIILNKIISSVKILNDSNNYFLFKNIYLIVKMKLANEMIKVIIIFSIH